MTEEEREKLIEDMARAIHATEWDADYYDFSDQPLHIKNLYRTEARAALAVADEAISKHYRARIAELEVALKNCADDLEAELRARYGCVKGGPIHPAENKRFQRDMDSVYAARAALKGEMK